VTYANQELEGVTASHIYD